jgi:hypothetical protein
MGPPSEPDGVQPFYLGLLVDAYRLLNAAEDFSGS